VNEFLLSQLANPSQLTTHPPPPMYPQISSFVSPQVSSVSGPSSFASTTGKFSVKPSSIITNAQTFTLPLGTQGNTQPQYPPSFPPQGQYPTMPYYFPPPYTGASYIPISPAAPPASSAEPSIQQHLVPGGSAGSQGAWTDEEQERLKQLAEQSKSVGNGDTIEWDWVVHQWGSSRTRYVFVVLWISSSYLRYCSQTPDPNQGYSFRTQGKFLPWSEAASGDHPWTRGR
jgi:hypothetical protein